MVQRCALVKLRLPVEPVHSLPFRLFLCLFQLALGVQWWLLFAFGWLACMLLGMHFLEYIDVFVIHRNTSSWLTAMVPLHANSTLFHALKQSSKPSTTTASARRPPPLCSTAHLKPIAAHLYATTPIETLPFLSLPHSHYRRHRPSHISLVVELQSILLVTGVSQRMYQCQHCQSSAHLHW